MEFSIFHRVKKGAIKDIRVSSDFSRQVNKFILCEYRRETQKNPKKAEKRTKNILV